jgi:hypothetical protein
MDILPVGKRIRPPVRIRERHTSDSNNLRSRAVMNRFSLKIASVLLALVMLVLLARIVRGYFSPAMLAPAESAASSRIQIVGPLESAWCRSGRVPINFQTGEARNARTKNGDEGAAQGRSLLRCELFGITDAARPD